MIACYSIIGSSVVIARADHRGDSTAADFYGRPPNDDTENPGMGYIMGVLSSFGSVLYAFGYAIVIPDIHASLHDHNTTDSQKDMKKATYSAFMFAYPAYLLAALVGYGAFGATVNDEVLLSLNNYLAPAAMYFIWAFVIIKVSTEAAIFNQCAFTLIRDMVGLTIDHDHVDYHSRNKWIDYMLRFVWLVLTTLIAMFVPVVSIYCVICMYCIYLMYIIYAILCTSLISFVSSKHIRRSFVPVMPLLYYIYYYYYSSVICHQLVRP